MNKSLKNMDKNLKVFETTFDLGGKGSPHFKRFHDKLLKLVKAYRIYYNSAIEALHRNEDISTPKLLEAVLKEEIDPKHTFSSKLARGAVNNAMKVYFKWKSSDKTFVSKHYKNLFMSGNSLTAFLIGPSVYVNRGGYLIIPYIDDQILKFRLSDDDFIPVGDYKNSFYYFDGFRWHAKLQCPFKDKHYKKEKLKEGELSVFLKEDGAVVVNEKVTDSVLDCFTVEELYNSLEEKIIEYEMARKRQRSMGIKKDYDLDADLRKINTIKRRLRDFNKAHYLDCVKRVTDSNFKRVCLTADVDFNSKLAEKVELRSFISLLIGACKLYGIELSLKLNKSFDKDLNLCYS